MRGLGHHNHATDIPAALKHRRVSDATEAKLKSLFRHYHSPSTALQTLDMELREEWGEEYPLKAADRSLLPDLSYVYRFVSLSFHPAYPSSHPTVPIPIYACHSKQLITMQ